MITPKIIPDIHDEDVWDELNDFDNILDDLTLDEQDAIDEFLEEEFASA